ncbi:MAG: glycolate oxidase subunit GlcE [Alphaproteobacteria bacterium]
MPLTQNPTDEDQLAALFADAAAHHRTLELRAGGTRRDMGAPRAADIVDLTAFTGIVDYDPPELVLTVRPATPLAEIEKLLTEQGQMLAFEPFDPSPLFGEPAGGGTIGGAVLSGTAGSGRLTAGAPRDHLLGLTAISGRGERFVAGGKVVKNVTGYDLPKLIAGSWGRLAAVTEMTLKVLPRPRMVRTLAIEGLSPAAAHRAMACALGGPCDISAAAHLPADGDRPSLTLLRVQGFAPSVEARCLALPDLLRDHGRPRTLSDEEQAHWWNAVRIATPLRNAPTLWRVSLPAHQSSPLIARLDDGRGRWLMDWAGGLLWLASDAAPDHIRAVTAELGGHAMLVRAPAELRARIPFEHPRPSGVMALERRVRRAFDPAGIFESGRFLDQDDAD